MAMTHGIPETHTHRHGTDYGDVWAALCSPEYRVLDEEGNNMAAGRVRHLLGKYWLYVDDTDGYEVLEKEEVEHLILEEDAE